MIDISKNSVFNLKPIKTSEVREELQLMLVPGEEILQAFRTVRDQFIFTNKRIITIDVKGVGKRKEYSSLPYNKIQYFSVQTTGLLELVPDGELELYFTNGFKANFEFKGSVNILQLGRVISGFVL